MNREIPVPLIRANQILLVGGTVIAIIWHVPWIIYALFAIVAAGFTFGPKLNAPFQLTKYAMGARLFYSETEAAELQRFNQLIAFTFLGAATVVLALTGHWSGYALAGCVTAAATSALLGYCIGCTVYFQYKMRSRAIRAKAGGKRLCDFIEGQGAFIPMLQDRFHPLMMMGLAHEAFRHELDAIDLLAGETTTATLPALKTATMDFAREIELHAAQEDSKMYPMINARRAGLGDPFEAEHAAAHGMQLNMERLLAVAGTDAAKLGDARTAVTAWTQFHRKHLRHEEERVQAHIPRIFSIDQAQVVLEAILTLAPDEFERSHVAYVFSRLEPGQRYMYASILLECVTQPRFGALENKLKGFVPKQAWERFRAERAALAA